MRAIRTLYDDGRELSIQASVNGELCVKLGDSSPVYVFAVELYEAVAEEAASAARSLRTHSTPPRRLRTVRRSP